MTPGNDASSITSVLNETRVFPPADGVRPHRPTSRAWNSTRRSGTGPRTTPRASGPSRPGPSTGSGRGTRCSTGTRRSPSGSSAASSTPRTTASTATATGRARTRRRSSGRASRATAASSATRTSSARSPSSPTCSRGWASRRATSSRSTCRWSPSWRSRMLACARIGAPHTVIFGGFSAEALAGRIQDCKAKVLVTADGGYRRGKVVPLKEHADGAAADCPTIQHVVVYRRTGHDVAMAAGPRPLVARADGTAPRADCPPEPVDSEHPALHPLHLRLDRQAQGDPPHHRRLPARHGADDRSGSSTSRTTTSTGAPPTSAG